MTAMEAQRIGLISALQKSGMSKDDVQIVGLQHPEGRVALAAGRVDAWAGLDPDWAETPHQRSDVVLRADHDVLTRPLIPSAGQSTKLRSAEPQEAPPWPSHDSTLISRPARPRNTKA